MGEGGGGDGGMDCGGGGMFFEVFGMDRFLVNFSVGGVRNCRSFFVIFISRRKG